VPVAGGVATLKWDLNESDYVLLLK